MTNHIRVLLLCLGSVIAIPAQANFFSLPFGIEGEYSVSLNYAAAMRVQSQNPALTIGKMDPLEPVVLNEAQGLVGFERTGLPDASNFDDGNRNFDRGSLIFNRVSALSEMVLDWRNFSIVVSGSGFYDDVYHSRTDNRDPEFLNRFSDRETRTVDPDSRSFSDAMKSRQGRRARVLDAYGVVDIPIGDFSFANIRVGQHLVAWGESLFFGGMASAQSRADATKAFVPGVEIKDILLPAPQVSARVGLGFDLTLLGYYKLAFRENDIFPVGDYFSPSDIVGPGAEFAYGSINPASGAGCPGLLDLDPLLGLPIDLSDLCNLAGPIGMLIDADDFIYTFRDADIRPPRSGQWGVGASYRWTPNMTLGLHFLRYHNPNPSVRLNTGFARIGEVLGQEVTTGIIGQAVPVTYNIEYFDGIKLLSGTFSTTMFGMNVAGELNFRDGQNIDVLTIASGVPTPIARRARTVQTLLSGISAFNPGIYFDEIAIVGEVGFVHVFDIDPLTEAEAQQGIEPQGDGDIPFFGRNAAGFQVLMLPRKRNFISGWDLGGMLSYQELTVGNPAQAGSFSALFGEGDRRLSVGVSMQYLQNLEFGLTYNVFFGDAEKRIQDSFVRANPFVDRDYVTFNIGYRL